MGRSAVRDAVVGGGQVVAVVVTPAIVRRRYNHRGGTDAEVASAMPGEDLVTQLQVGYTHAITIDAPPAAVWPWLAPVGQGRGYTCDVLENVVRCEHAERIVTARGGTS